jgi:hypothetical protein
MDTTSLGTAGLAGWRRKVADVVGPPVARRTPLDERAVRAVVGAAFFALSVWYVIGTVRRMGERAART